MPTCYDTQGNFTPCPVGGAAPTNFTDTLQQAVQGPGIGPGAGMCPMQPDGSCVLGGQPVSCVLIRECDAYDGANHVEYNTPGGAAPNANIWTVDGSGNLVYLDAKGNPTTPPQYAAPPYLDKGVFTSQFNPDVQAKLSAVGVVAGMEYNPSSGWTPAANTAPVETGPSIPAFTNTNNKVASTTNQASTPTEGKPAGTAKAAAVGQPGAPGTSGTKVPITTKPKSNALILVAAAAAIILLSRM